MNPITHLDLARICRVAYSNKTFCERDVEVFVVEHSFHRVIAFRGTEASKLWPSKKVAGKGWFGKVKGSLKNWLDVVRDVRFIPWHDKRVGWAHSGFLKGSRCVCDKHLVKLPTDKKLIITGHSLGGALALVAAQILRQTHDIEEVVVFGCPRVFLWNSVDRFSNIRVCLYRNGHDLVTTVPHSFYGYRHPRELSQLGSFKSSQRSISRWHSIEKYIKSLCSNES